MAVVWVIVEQPQEQEVQVILLQFHLLKVMVEETERQVALLTVVEVAEVLVKDVLSLTDQILLMVKVEQEYQLKSQAQLYHMLAVVVTAL